VLGSLIVWFSFPSSSLDRGGYSRVLANIPVNHAELCLMDEMGCTTSAGNIRIVHFYLPSVGGIASSAVPNEGRFVVIIMAVFPREHNEP